MRVDVTASDATTPPMPSTNAAAPISGLVQLFTMNSSPSVEGAEWPAARSLSVVCTAVPSCTGYHDDEQNHEQNNVDELKYVGPLGTAPPPPPRGWFYRRRPLVGLL
jgi:hypothetical protein